MPEWAGPKLQLRREIRKGLNHQYLGRICFCEHHQSHAASAFYASPFQEAAILTLDGVGEWATSSMGFGRGGQIELTHEIRFPHSLGLLYSAFTYFAGFRVNSDEYKLMGLAPYGQPRYVDLIYEKLVRVFEDGSYRLCLDYFDYPQGLKMTSRQFHRLFGASPRQASEPIRELDMDLAASIQKVTEEIVLRAASHLYQLTGSENLCLAGGVALNCVSNGRLLREGPFKQVWVQPASGDAGGALGVAQLMWHQLMEKPRTVSSPDGQQGSLLGPGVISDSNDSSKSLANLLDDVGASYQVFSQDSDLTSYLASQLDEGKLIGIARGRMEFGPRALGNRSIVADPRRGDTQRELNLKTKFRESFRPFAPIVLRDRVQDYFEWDPSHESPYMLMVTQVNSAVRKQIDHALPKGLDRVNDIRSVLPAVTHVDYSARLQTVDQIRNPFLWRLLNQFNERTGCPVLVNTSFNVKDEPIVCSWSDSLACFLQTNLDTLVLENFVLEKSQQQEVDLTKLQAIRDLPFSQDRTRESQQNLQFVMSLTCALGLISVILWYRFQSPWLSGIFLFGAASVATVSCFGAVARKWVERQFKRLTLPIRWLVTLVLLGILYYLVVTPIGFFLRLRGRDLRKDSSGSRSQWIRTPDRDVESYFRTY
jgi:carbamoyltransferase